MSIARDETDAGDPGVTIDVRRGTPTEEELAALIAVVSQAYTGEASEAVAEEPRCRSGWELSARSMRQPLNRDLGWGRFG
ncbi:acyl-CoA carboxylase subunit epsilon [Microbacterium jejuense]|uniref:Acyl-CoA carboxylase subunit epsilon n=1 Tax=Microbacterium jejuense TaxID=1263637 RepID=A0ABS7HQ69_9MICO|nr:acyl-CoA carboxylase subunit epsilon [Microbacterium jejuense]MBW9094589.1 acyl-CoA carboxylase subunit epsilon [Microbacterium jejuense]